MSIDATNWTWGVVKGETWTQYKLGPRHLAVLLKIADRVNGDASYWGGRDWLYQELKGVVSDPTAISKCITDLCKAHILLQTERPSGKRKATYKLNIENLSCADIAPDEHLSCATTAPETFVRVPPQHPTTIYNSIKEEENSIDIQPNGWIEQIFVTTNIVGLDEYFSVVPEKLNIPKDDLSILEIIKTNKTKLTDPGSDRCFISLWTEYLGRVPAFSTLRAVVDNQGANAFPTPGLYEWQIKELKKNNPENPDSYFLKGENPLYKKPLPETPKTIKQKKQRRYI